MLDLWIHSKPSESSDKFLVIKDLPWYAVFLERLVCTWPFYYWNGEISAWFWNISDNALEVKFLLTEEQEKLVKRDFWGVEDE
jgi:hypothetical protein